MLSAKEVLAVLVLLAVLVAVSLVCGTVVGHLLAPLANALAV